jgi:hypothetical protein
MEMWCSLQLASNPMRGEQAGQLWCGVHLRKRGSGFGELLTIAFIVKQKHAKLQRTINNLPQCMFAHAACLAAIGARLPYYCTLPGVGTGGREWAWSNSYFISNSFLSNPSLVAIE